MVAAPDIVVGDRLPARAAAASGMPLGLSFGLHGVALFLALAAGLEGNALQGDSAVLIELSLAPSASAGGATAPSTEPPGEPPSESPEPERQEAAAEPPSPALAASLELPLPDVPPPPEIPPPADAKVELAPADEPPPLDMTQLAPAPDPTPPSKPLEKVPEKAPEKPAVAKPAAPPSARPPGPSAADKAKAAAPSGARPQAATEGDGSSTRQALAGFLANAPPVFDGKARFRHPPTPAVYPSRALELGQQGEVLIRIRLDTNGTAVEILVSRSSGSDLLDRAALTAVRGWHFLPAVRDGHAVAAWVEIPVRFHLR